MRQYTIYIRSRDKHTDEFLEKHLPNQKPLRKAVPTSRGKLQGLWKLEEHPADELLNLLEDDPGAHWQYFRRKGTGVARLVGIRSREVDVGQRAG